MFIHNLSISIAVALLSPLVIAAPSLTGLGTQSADTDSGQYEVTISGSDFGNGPTVLLYDNFNVDEELVGELVTTEPPAVGTWESGTSTYYQYDYTGPNKAQQDTGMLVVNPDTKTMLQMRLDLGTSYEEVFVSYNVYIPSGHSAYTTEENTWPKESSWKLAWLFDQGGYGHSDGLADLIIPSHIGNYGQSALIGNSGYWVTSEGSRTYAPYMNTWWDWKGRNYFSFWFQTKQSGTSIADVFYQTTNTNDLVYTQQGTDSTLQYDGTPLQFDQINFPGWFKSMSESPFDAVYDEIYVAVGDNAKARIEVTNNSDYISSGMILTLPPSSWSSNSVTLNIPSTLIDNEELYLFVTDSEGNRSEGLDLTTIRNSVSTTDPEITSPPNPPEYFY